jgi:hydroxymethylpyrimidine pyrophosphatase-like HAD family hydrolase
MIAFCDDFDESLFLPHLKNCKAARWDEYAVDIMPKDSDKAKGILAVLEYYGWTQDNAMSLGDGNNDIDMLLFTGVSVAVGGALPDVKAVADYVTDDIDNDGWAKAMKHYGLIQ